MRSSCRGAAATPLSVDVAPRSKSGAHCRNACARTCRTWIRLARTGGSRLDIGCRVLPSRGHHQSDEVGRRRLRVVVRGPTVRRLAPEPLTVALVFVAVTSWRRRSSSSASPRDSSPGTCASRTSRLQRPFSTGARHTRRSTIRSSRIRRGTCIRRSSLLALLPLTPLPVDRRGAARRRSECSRCSWLTLWLLGIRDIRCYAAACCGCRR